MAGVRLRARLDDVEHWDRFVAGFRYKPNVKLEVFANRDGLPLLKVTMRVPDARWTPPKRKDYRDGIVGDVEWGVDVVRVIDHGGPNIPIVPVGVGVELPKWESPQAAALHLRGLLLDLESHEIDEWIVVDGVRLFDPHVSKAERERMIESLR